MPHADSSYFEPGLSKEQVYAQVLQQAEGLVDGQRNWVSNLANISSLLWHAYAALPSPSSAVNWAGFYVRSDKFPSASQSSSSTTQNPQTQTQQQKKPILLLGPFHGKPACQLIHFGRGVCGTAAEQKQTLLVPDVLKFPGHIACDAESRSEIVVPVVMGGETVAIIDVDCTLENGFDEVDRQWLEKLAVLIGGCCDW